MRRRDFIKAIGSSLAAWPSALSAQPTERIRVVGALMSQGNDSRSQANLAQLRDSLRDLGWTDDRNLRLEVRWAAGEMDRTRIFALELAKLSPDVILAAGTAAIAALNQFRWFLSLSTIRSRKVLSQVSRIRAVTSLA
jgi:putative ABC transport system substrate-binding protein